MLHVNLDHELSWEFREFKKCKYFDKADQFARQL